MKQLLIILALVFSLNISFGQQKPKRTELQTKSSLAIKYYNLKDYERALPLLQEVHKLSRNTTYFRYYLNCLVQLQRFEEAEKSIALEIKKSKTPRPEMYINWGYVLKAQKKSEEAKKMYEKAIDLIPKNKGNYLITASNFISWQEFEYAKKTYLKGRKELAPEPFYYEMALAYYYLRDYSNMMEEYLNLLRQDIKRLGSVQSRLSSVMRLDIDNELRNNFRKQVLKRIQAEPQVIAYNRLLIWFFLQEKKFSSALRQSVSLDRRTGQEDAQILTLGILAMKDKQYAEAKKAFEYLMEKGPTSAYFPNAFIQNIRSSYMEFTTNSPDNLQEGEKLVQKFKDGMEFLGYGHSTIGLIRDYAHVLAFYLGRSEDAIAVLERGLKIPQLKPQQSGVMKTELADIYVYANDPWEATLVYSQVIDENKTNTLGDEVKLKKAKLGYYMGNFSWAKAQLDVLKASTSKLTANDAMALSMLIGNNLNLDTTDVPLTMFAKADLLFFQNRGDEAMIILEGLMETYPSHTLVDDILWRKAKINIENQNYSAAAEYLETITNDFSYDLLGDDALFQLAELYNFHLDQKEKAKELYKKMLTSHPGSVFIEESRTKYRELREIYPDKTPEEEFMDGKKEGLFQRAIDNTEF